jgi:hypothetical protein
MKNFLLLFAISGLLSLGSVAQTATGSASGNASVSPGQVDAGAKASQSTQAAGASANANASAQGEVRTEHKGEQESKSKAGSGPRHNSGGSASAWGTGSSAALSSGTTLNGELTHSLDAKSCKPGDQVTAKLTEDVKSDGKVVVPKGSKLVGHVTEAKARSKDNADSRLGIVFDKAVLKSGQELSFIGAVQAMAPPVNAALSAAGDESSNISAAGPSGSPRRSGGGGLLGGAAGTVGGATSTATGVVDGATGSVATTTTGAVSGTTGLAGGLTAQGRLTSASQGAIGLQGLTLNSVSAANAQGSIVSSTTRNVKLESGTQMLLKVTGSAQ